MAGRAKHLGPIFSRFSARSPLFFEPDLLKYKCDDLIYSQVMQKSKCPACNSDVIIGEDAFEGDLLDCSNCGAELEVVALHPPVLAETGNHFPADEEE